MNSFLNYKNYSLLIVDDNPQNLELLGRILKDKGYNIRFARNGYQALNSIKVLAPDLILLDIMMPEIDGYEVCRQLKADPILKDIPVIFISAKTEIFDKIRGFKVGAVDYIIKPFEMEEVLARVKTHLKLREYQKELEEKNIKLLQNYKALVENIPQKVFLKDRNSIYISCNSKYAKDFGITPQEINGKSDFDFYPRDLAIKYQQDDQEVMQSKTTKNIIEEYEIGENRNWVHTIKKAVLDEEGNSYGVIGIFGDITKEKEIEMRLKENEKRLTEAEKIAHVGNWELEISTGNCYWSDEFYRICGYQPGEIPATLEQELKLIHPKDRDETRNAINWAIEKKQNFEIEKRLIRPDQTMRHVVSRGKIITGENEKPIKLIGTILDITERKRAEEKVRILNEVLEEKVKQRTAQLEAATIELEKLSILDPLTGIYNRRFFSEAIKREFQRSLRTAMPLSIIMFDLDFFKKLNDNYGHQYGDKCLKDVVGAAKKILKRPTDIFARYGGEEFIIILPETNAQGAYYLAEEIRKAVNKKQIKHEYSSVKPFLTISLGVGVNNEMGIEKYHQLIKLADDNLYKAKQKGRNCTVI